MSSEFLRKSGEMLRSGRAIEERLCDFTGLVGSHVPGAHATVLLFERESDDFLLRATSLRLPANRQDLQFGARGTVAGLALRERRPLLLSEINRAAGAHGRGEMIFLPLLFAGDTIGVLAVESVADNGALKECADTLAEAAAILSEALGASLREESASLRMTKIAAINEAGVNIISTLDLERLLKLVATSANLIMEAESCVIRLLDPQTGKYAIREYHGTKRDAEQKELFRMDTKAVTLLLKGAPAVLVRDASEEAGWREFAGVARTMVGLPLRQGTEIIGTMSVFDKFPAKTFYPGTFGVDDQATFEKFARYCEKAVANAMAFERNERLRSLDELTGLPTLRYFQDRLLHEISRAKRFQRRLVLMICEVAPKMEGGEAVSRSRADTVVKRIGSVIRLALREYDILARIGERKFAMLLPEAEDGKSSAIPRIKKAILADVDELRKGTRGITVDVRFGHAAFPEDGDDHEKLIFKSNLMKV
ncbi:MAG TPA: diguanylate cyclase [Candidatus Deferrimicrobiaceae bacterium]|jgi:diguanylate cyclase (GGDEF)-like protein